MQAQSWYLDYLIDPSFQVSDMLFLFSFENGTERLEHTGDYPATVDIKYHNVMIDGRNIFDQLEII